MDNPQHKAFDQELAATLSRGRSVAVTGFADRVVGAVRADRRRRVDPALAADPGEQRETPVAGQVEA